MEDAYESYPAWTPLLSNLVGLSIYAIGAYILAGFSVIIVIPYLLYCLWVEIGVLRGACIDCHYYGKVCAFGKGKLCSLMFKRGDPRRFVEREVSWSKVLPDLMVPALPVIGGAILLVRDFSWPLVALLAILLALSLGGNVVIRGSLACKHCRQGQIGCPAAQLFGGDKSSRGGAPD
jgi:hypothetical protein